MTSKKFSDKHVNGVNSFMHFVRQHMGKECDIRCPCENCLNNYIKSQDKVKSHLFHPRIDKDYTRWIYHGEKSDFKIPRSSDNSALKDVDLDNRTTQNDTIDNDGMLGMVRDLENLGDNLSRFEGASDSTASLTNNLPQDFKDLIKEAEQELFPGCTAFSKLSFIVKVLHLKVYNKWSNKSIDMLLEFLRQVIPNGQTLPKSYYDAKNILKDLGLGYIAIHACKHDCVLFWKKYEKNQNCPICGTSRWKVNDGKRKKYLIKYCVTFL